MPLKKTADNNACQLTLHCAAFQLEVCSLECPCAPEIQANRQAFVGSRRVHLRGCLIGLRSLHHTEVALFGLRGTQHCCT